MASRTLRSVGRYWIEITLGVAAAALAAGAFAPLPADARTHAKKLPEDFTAVRAPLAPAEPPPANGAIFQTTGLYSALYQGARAHAVGDPLTIILVEATAATKSADSKLGSNGAFGLQPPTTGPLSVVKSTDLALSGNRSFTGSGTSDQANSLTGAVSVTVAQVYPNGTLLVQGQKRVTLNRGDEFVKIKGLVRIADIDADNNVLSTRVADAQISYTGKGDVARASRQGWLSRFFSVISPF